MSSRDHERWREISPHLDEVLSLAPSERAAWLEAFSTREPALAGHLRELLDDHSSLDSRGFLQDAPAADLHASLAGQRIGAYTLLRPLGEGGMGAVWLGERSDGRFEGRAAIKLVHRSLLARSDAERFTREGTLLARLSHPNIARLLDAGVAAGGQPYLVLEYVDGESIDRYCDDHACSVEQRIALFLDVLGAVTHAHNNLILHRDIKASNILVTREGVVKLLDFGIGKLLDEPSASAAPAATQFAGAAFTPSYAAPEQLQAQDVSAATDVYSLGVLLYELLAGCHPTSRASDSPLDRARAVIEREPDRLSDACAVLDEAGLRARGTTRSRLVRRLQGDLDNIVARALKKSPIERYASVAEFQDDVRRHLDDLPVRARPDSFAYRSRKFLRRNRIGVAVAATILLSLGVGAAVALWQAIEADKQRDRALSQLQRTEAAQEFIDLMIFSTWGDDERITRDEFLERSEALALRSFAGQAEPQVVVLHSLASNYGSLGNNERAEALLRRALQRLPADADPTWRANLECNHAVQSGLLGDADSARATLNRWIVRRDIEPDVAAQCEMYLAQLAQRYDDPKGALAHALGAQRSLARATRRLPALHASLHGDLGYGYAMNGELAEADRQYDIATRMYRELGQGDSPAMSAILNNWSLAIWRTGDPRGALEVLDEIIRISGGRGRGEVPLYARANRAGYLQALGRHREAVELATAVLADARRTNDRLFEQNAMFTLLTAHARLGEFTAADKIVHEFDEMLRAHPDAGFDAVGIELRRARLEQLRGHPAAAKAFIEPVIAALPDAATAGLTLASALSIRSEAGLALGQQAQARDDAERALAIANEARSGRPYSLRAGEYGLLLARVEQALGEETAARASARSALRHLTAMLDAAHPDVQTARELARATDDAPR